MPARTKFWLNWIQVVTIMFIAFGTIMFIWPFAENTIGEFYYEQIVGDGTYVDLSEAEIDFQQFLYGVSGAVLASWQLLVYFITKNALARGEQWAWTAIVLSLILWFVGDGYASISMGFPIHAGMNLSMVVMLGVPLAMLKRDI